MHRDFKVGATQHLGPFNGQDAGFNPEFFEGHFHLLNQCLFHLGFGIDDLANQTTPQWADLLAHDFASIGDLDDQHSPYSGRATLSAQGVKNLFQIPKLASRYQAGQGQSGGATTNRYLNGLQGLPGGN